MREYKSSTSRRLQPHLDQVISACSYSLLLLQYHTSNSKMRIFLLSAVTSTFFALAYGAGSAVQGTGSTTRQWSCCKNSCSWPGKALVYKPVLTCDASDNLLDNYNRRDGCESGGGSYACSDLSPWAASNDLAYGFAAVNLAASNESAWCCSCYSYVRPVRYPSSD